MDSKVKPDAPFYEVGVPTGDDFGDKRMVWIDLETTHLKPVEGLILELGLAITDQWGEMISRRRWLVLEEGWHEKVTSMMDGDDTVSVMHRESGLLDEMLFISPEGLEGIEYVDKVAPEKWGSLAARPATVAKRAIEWLDEQGIRDKGQHELCGSTVSFDKGWLEARMPTLAEFFHYRVVDVSSLQIVCEKVSPAMAEFVPSGRKIHRVFPDLEDSIAKYKFFLDNFLFVPGEQSL